MIGICLMQSVEMGEPPVTDKPFTMEHKREEESSESDEDSDKEWYGKALSDMDEEEMDVLLRCQCKDPWKLLKQLIFTHIRYMDGLLDLSGEIGWKMSKFEEIKMRKVSITASQEKKKRFLTKVLNATDKTGNGSLAEIVTKMGSFAEITANIEKREKHIRKLAEILMLRQK
jgi:hypothetical protein